MKRINVIFIIFLLSCYHNKPTCVLTSDDLLKKYPDRVYIAYNPDKIILGISDKEVNSTKGGSYYFLKNGKLQSYKFFQTPEAYTYEEEYNENGEIVKVSGKLIVDKRIREVNLDSAFIRLYLFSLHKTYRNIQVKINSTHNINLEYKEDSLYSNMKIASFGMDTKSQKQINLYFQVEYQDDCTGKNCIYLDTLSMIKNPHLNSAKITQ